MTTPPSAGQATPPSSPSVAEALSTLARAAAELSQRGVVEVGPLLAAYRALAPVGHAGAQGIAPDLELLAATASFGAPLLGAEAVEVCASVPRAPPSVRPDDVDERRARLFTPPGVESGADALTLTLGVALEAAKLVALLDDPATPAGDLVDVAAGACGVTPDDVARALGAPDRATALAAFEDVLRGGVVRRVELAASARAGRPIDDVMLDVALNEDGPLFVLAGATERVQDLLSPWVRRLERPLARLAGSPAADELYAALPLLLAEEPRAHDERLEVEAREGFTPCGDAVVVRFERVDPARADERTRTSLRALKQSRARAVLTGRDPETLRAVLARVGRRARVVAVLGEALGARSPYPDVVVDAVSGHPLDLDNALADPERHDEVASVCISPPSLGLSPRAFLEQGVGCAPLLAPLLLEAVHARAAGWLARQSRLAAGISPPGDSAAASSVALRCLARMSGVTPLPRRQAPRPG